MEGLHKEIEMYSEIRSFSLKENTLLKKSAPLKTVYSFIPYKVKILEDIQHTEERIASLKTLWMECREQKIPLPGELNVLLKTIEKILGETIELDEQNKNLMSRYIRGLGHFNTASDPELNYSRAVNAYKGKY